ncbi:hypothetical protein LPJ73_003357 [Coemansia sp. RSA 2703]|nr:hypothetical protein LPJ73_003357 [Coemansia sp. RSA 2703]KAJ2377196.1 hypothetical protein IW150_001520 [Coemansia sp. RSA 2607]KAJ2395439.1 hypothetical protein GGI05_001587 [Coemansia sp. RSA 2603]
MLTPSQVDFYHTHGYLIVEEFLTSKEVRGYTDEAQTLINHCYEQGDIVAHWGCVVEPFGCGFFDSSEIPRNACTTREGFIALRSTLSAPDVAVCTLNKFGRCARQLLAKDEAEKTYLLNDQYIVKPPREDKAEFAWHQDILYFSEAERKHSIVSIWTPLDDVDITNGTVLVDPFPDPTRPGIYDHDSAAGSSSRVFPAVMSAGSALFMDGRLRHCSTGNMSTRFRTVYMPQFSLGQIRITRGADTAFTALAVPIDEQM